MTPAAFHRAALALKGATWDVKWGADRIYSVGSKMFAGASPPGERDPHFSFKTSDIAFEMLVAEGVAVPAPYLARAKWVRLVSADALPARTLKSYLAEAHAIVASRLTRKLRAELGLTG